MGIQLDWRVDEEEEEPPERRRRRLPTSSVTTLVALVILVTILGIGWKATQEQAQQAEERLLEEVQQTLDRQRDALLQGDGDLFFSFFTPDPAWRMVQLRAELQVSMRAGLAVNRVSSQGVEIWTNVTWQHEGERLQRVLFFRRRLLARTAAGEL